MSLHASVSCDCFEKGAVVRPPPQAELVYVNDAGQISLRWDAPGADQHAFCEWLDSCCPHGPMGTLVEHHLGNVALVGFLREIRSPQSNRFPLLLSRVLFNGVHGGDCIPTQAVRDLALEVKLFAEIHSPDPELEALIRLFQSQMSELVSAAVLVGKPIAF